MNRRQAYLLKGEGQHLITQKGIQIVALALRRYRRRGISPTQQCIGQIAVAAITEWADVETDAQIVLPWYQTVIVQLFASAPSDI